MPASPGSSSRSLSCTTSTSPTPPTGSKADRRPRPELVPRCLAAIQGHHHPADIARPVGGEEHRQIGHLVGLGGTSERHVLGELAPALGVAKLLLRRSEE